MSEMEKLLFLLKEHGRIEGRTRFQKLVFLLKEEFEVPFRFEYIPYYYGPYSYDLAEYMSYLVSYGLVRENRHNVGYEMDRYDYTLTDMGEGILEEKAEKSPVLDRIARAISEMKTRQTKQLVRRAKHIMKS